MKGLSELLIIVVTVIVILIAAFVLVSIFVKGNAGIVDTAEKVRATGQCSFRCAAICSQFGETEGEVTKGKTAWDKETVTIGDKIHPCGEFVDTCNCGSKPEPVKR